MKEHYLQAVWMDLLLPAELHFYGARPERLIDTVQGAGDGKTIVIDEKMGIRFPEAIFPA